jgi:antitoxin (DNA-binding transcriptional repressor) of toxin-antitoxin stability system
MKTITFTDFRKKASGFISEVEKGETFILLCRGKPVAEISPFRDEIVRIPSWKGGRRKRHADGRSYFTPVRTALTKNGIDRYFRG